MKACGNVLKCCHLPLYCSICIASSAAVSHRSAACSRLKKTDIVAIKTSYETSSIKIAGVEKGTAKE